MAEAWCRVSFCTGSEFQLHSSRRQGSHCHAAERCVRPHPDFRVFFTMTTGGASSTAGHQDLFGGVSRCLKVLQRSTCLRSNWSALSSRRDCQVSRALRNRCLEIFMEGTLGGAGLVKPYRLEVCHATVMSHHGAIFSRRGLEDSEVGKRGRCRSVGMTQSRQDLSMERAGDPVAAVLILMSLQRVYHESTMSLQ